MNDRLKILLIFTGGTICSFQDETGHNDVNTHSAAPILTEILRNSDSRYKDAEIETVFPLNVLSENMTIELWEELIAFLKTVDMTKYDGIIMTHGTDSIHMTAPLIELLLRGSHIPVGFLAAQRILSDPESNGPANLIASVDHIGRCRDFGKCGSFPLFFFYRNTDGVMYYHRAGRLLNCRSFSEDFESPEMIEASKLDYEMEYTASQTMEQTELLLHRIDKLRRGVLRIDPYVGIDYDTYNLDRVSAVLHTTYHSGTANAPLLKGFVERCRARGIKVYLAPVDEEFRYSTTYSIINAGAQPLFGLTEGQAFAAIVTGTV